MKQNKQKLVKKAIALLEAKTGKKVVLKEANYEGYDSLEEALGDLEDSSLFQLWNEYQQTNNFNDEFYNNDEEFYNTFFPNSYELAKVISNETGFSLDNDYVKFDRYGGITTFDSVSDYVDLGELANWITRNDIDLAPYGLEPVEDEDIEIEDNDEELI